MENAKWAQWLTYNSSPKARNKWLYRASGARATLYIRELQDRLRDSASVDKAEEQGRIAPGHQPGAATGLCTTVQRLTRMYTPVCTKNGKRRKEQDPLRRKRGSVSKYFREAQEGLPVGRPWRGILEQWGLPHQDPDMCVFVHLSEQ